MTSPQEMLDQQASRRRRWLLIGGVVLVVVVLVVTALKLGSGDGEDAAGQGSTDQESKASSSPASKGNTGSAAGNDKGGADGCLGGPDAATAVVEAQRVAPLTAPGAAAFVATFNRWSDFTPRVDNARDQKIVKTVMRGPTKKTYEDAGYIAQAPEGATQGWTETAVNSHYRIVASEPTRAVVDVWLRQHVMKGEKEQTYTVGNRTELRAKDGHWFVWKVNVPADWRRVADDDFRGTQTFSEGC